MFSWRTAVSTAHWRWTRRNIGWTREPYWTAVIPISGSVASETSESSQLRLNMIARMET